MGQEVSAYVRAMVGAMQAAYGERWNITARGESAEDVSGKPWAVQVGYAGFVPEPRGDLGIDLETTCAATVSYAGTGPTHNDGFQEADIAATLASWMSGRVVGGALAKNVKMEPEPVTVMRGGVEIPTGQYLTHVFWDVRLDDIDPDIVIEGYETRHPSRPLADEYYWEIEFTDGTRRVVKGAKDEPPPLPEMTGVRVRRVIIADPLNVPPQTDDEVYYPLLVEATNSWQ